MTKLIVFPAWRDNPFLNLLHLEARARVDQYVGIRTLDELIHELNHSNSTTVLHMNWTSPIVQRASDTADARARLSRFRSALERARAHGLRLVWTVHNVLPHECAFVDIEIELHRLLAESSDVVHIMSAATPEIVAEHYTLREQSIVRIPHPSYWGVYEQNMTREDARAHFAIEQHETALGFVGQVRPYKGISTLARAFNQLATEDDYHLLIAGKAHDDDIAEVRREAGDHGRTTIRGGFVPDNDLQKWFGASDVVVLPYAGILNSGSIALAATFGRAVIVPDEYSVRAEFADENWVVRYDPSDAVSSLSEALRSGESSWRDLGASAQDWARSHSPHATSRAFAELVLRSRD